MLKYQTQHCSRHSRDSQSIIPIYSDFMGLITPLLVPFQVLLATTRDCGIVTVKSDIRDSMGTSISIETTDYYIPEAEIRLFLPQGYFYEKCLVLLL